MNQMVGAIRALVKVCHPAWPERPEGWYQAVNNVTIYDGALLIGWSAWSLTLAPTSDLSKRLGPDAYCAILWDTCVDPGYRGRGLAKMLMDQRLKEATEAGCCMALGACAPSNAAMVKLLQQNSFDKVARADNVFPDGAPGDIYVKGLAT